MAIPYPDLSQMSCDFNMCVKFVPNSIDYIDSFLSFHQEKTKSNVKRTKKYPGNQPTDSIKTVFSTALSIGRVSLTDFCDRKCAIRSEYIMPIRP